MIKKKVPLIIFIVFLLLVLFSIVTFPKLFYEGITNTLSIWLYNVYPSIFTFYIISSCLINFNILSRLTFLFKPFIKLSSSKAYELFIISILVGNPSSASLIMNELEACTITESDAHKLLKINAFFNPLFIISIMTSTFLNHIKYAYLIVASMLITSIIFSYFYSSKPIKKESIKNQIVIKTDKIFTAINSAMYLLLIVAGVMVFSNIIKFSVNNLFQLLNINSPIITFIIANFEAATGVFDIINFNYNIPNTLALICFILTFQGISINLQVATVIKDFNINLGSLFISRILQGIICAIICLTLYILIFT